MLERCCETEVGCSRGGRREEEVGLRVLIQTLHSSRDSESQIHGIVSRNKCTLKMIADRRLPRLHPRMMATSRMETLAVRDEEDVESAREE